jgi:hypothetical protein
MTPLNVGMFAMIAAGFAGMAVALIVLSKRVSDGIKRPMVTSCISVLLLGVGTFGPSFMDPYGRLLGTLLGTKGDDADAKKYEDYFKQVADGKGGDEQETEVRLAHTLNYPVDNMDALLQKAIDKGTDEAGKQRLLSLKVAFDRKQQIASDSIKDAAPKSGAAASPAPAKLRLEAQEPAVKRLMQRQLQAMPKAERDRLAADDQTRRWLTDHPPPR